MWCLVEEALEAVAGDAEVSLPPAVSGDVARDDECFRVALVLGQRDDHHFGDRVCR